MEFDNQPVLLVEDNPGDVLLFKLMAQKSSIANPLQVMTTGEELIEYLTRMRKCESDSVRDKDVAPCVVFLDVRLTRMDGFEVLEWIRSDPKFASMKIIFLTSSSDPRDARRAYQLGALALIVKPPKPQVLREIFEGLRAGDSFEQFGFAGQTFNRLEAK